MGKYALEVYDLQTVFFLNFLTFRTMKRKNFIAGILPTVLSIGAISAKIEPTEKPSKIPPKLVPGDKIGIIAPAGYISLEDIQPALERLTAWGFQYKIGQTIGQRDNSFGGTDEQRLNDFNQMIANEEVKAILCARGGYGLVRIIDQINFDPLKKSPKWIIGFSDITVIHSHLNRQFGIASIHSKMCNSFPKNWAAAEFIQQQTIESIYKCLSAEKMTYSAPKNLANKLGVATGTLIGGNLRTLENLAGSKSDIQTKNKILFVEDTGEYLYSIDRMFWNLKRTGKLDELSGLIIGGFRIKQDDPGEEFGKTLEQIVLEKTKEYNYPISFDFPVGHQKNNFALKCGVKHRLDVNSVNSILEEI